MVHWFCRATQPRPQKSADFVVRLTSPLVGNYVGHINEVNQRQAWLLLGQVTVCKWVNHLGMQQVNQVDNSHSQAAANNEGPLFPSTAEFLVKSRICPRRQSFEEFGTSQWWLVLIFNSNQS